jgi:hypothetical protein
MNAPLPLLNQMLVMDRTGHTTVTWDVDDKVSVADAKDKFDEMVGRGYTAFAIRTIEDDGITVEEKGQRITTFDPKAGKIMLIPQLQGG